MQKAKPSLLGTLLPPLFLAEGAAQGVAGAPHPPTYRPIESGSQVGDEHLGVDGLQVPGEVLAVKLLPQLAPFCNVTIRLLSTKSREKIKLTSEASQETPPEPAQSFVLPALPPSVTSPPSPTAAGTKTGSGVLRDTAGPRQDLAAHTWDVLVSEQSQAAKNPLVL